MKPLDTEDRTDELASDFGVGYCHITKCCTRVCPEENHHHRQRDHSAQERVVDRLYDPLSRLLRVFRT